MKRLFMYNDRYSEDGLQLAREAHGAVRDLVIRWVKQGYSARDVQYIIETEVQSAALEEIMDPSNYKKEEDPELAPFFRTPTRELSPQEKENILRIANGEDDSYNPSGGD